MSDYGNPPPQNPYGQQPPYGGGPGTTDAKGFFGALFDFKFEHFVTPMIVKLVYVLALVALVLGWLILTVAGFVDSPGSGLVLLVVGALGLIVYLAFIRMTLEFYLAIVRMSEDIHHRLKP